MTVSTRTDLAALQCFFANRASACSTDRCELSCDRWCPDEPAEAFRSAARPDASFACLSVSFHSEKREDANQGLAYLLRAEAVAAVTALVRTGRATVEQHFLHPRTRLDTRIICQNTEMSRAIIASTACFVAFGKNVLVNCNVLAVLPSRGSALCLARCEPVRFSHRLQCNCNLQVYLSDGCGGNERQSDICATAAAATDMH